MHASVSMLFAIAESGKPVLEFNADKSLIPASIMKMITSAAALELLGPEHIFTTVIGYTGEINKRNGKLTGDIIIRGGGDPTLGSPYFSDHYNDFISAWVEEIKKTGIKEIDGRVITDDSYFDFQPVPAKWLWEDAGNYYGAGAFGLTVFDNTYGISFKTGNDSALMIKEIIPNECGVELSNWLIAAGTADNGYVFSAPYSTKGWLTGTIPADLKDFVLKASIADPPNLLARIVDKKLKSEGISVSKAPTTYRLEKINTPEEIRHITETTSPTLTDIIEVLNHESVNLYAEHLIKELGKKYLNNGSTAAGVTIVKDFLSDAGIRTDGMFIEDGSGLSPLNSINARELVNMLSYMKNSGKYYPEYLKSLPDAGTEGTLKNYFHDPVFSSRLKAKSGSMTRVRSYAGYFTTISGEEIIFTVIVNNYKGPSKNIISGIEDIIKEIILTK